MVVDELRWRPDVSQLRFFFILLIDADTLHKGDETSPFSPRPLLTSSLFFMHSITMSKICCDWLLL